LASPTPSRIRNSVFSITGRCTFYPVSSKLSTTISEMSLETESGTIPINHLNHSAMQTGTRYPRRQWMGKEGNYSPFNKLFEVTSDVFAGSITIPCNNGVASQFKFSDRPQVKLAFLSSIHFNKRT
jgi:hypothetical protein